MLWQHLDLFWKLKQKAINREGCSETRELHGTTVSPTEESQVLFTGNWTDRQRSDLLKE